ncbi:MAG: alpha/beta hydrolase [Oscillospiraceae bacterium]|nr:alpha/beta hydrolase [Oscillospiraceae bacterium]
MQYIFIHGLGQTALSWDKTISLLKTPARHSCPNLSDLIADKDVTYQNLYKAFSAYCNNISEPLCLCGLSLGGMLALNYTLVHPEKVKSLILIGTQYKIPKGLFKFQNLIFNILPKSAFKSMGFSKSDILRLTKSMIELDFSTELTKVSCDTLIICGAKDKANFKAANELSECILTAKLKIIENAAHEVNKDNPEELAKIIL